MIDNERRSKMPQVEVSKEVTHSQEQEPFFAGVDPQQKFYSRRGMREVLPQLDITINVIQNYNPKEALSEEAKRRIAHVYLWIENPINLKAIAKIIGQTPAQAEAYILQNLMKYEPHFSFIDREIRTRTTSKNSAGIMPFPLIAPGERAVKKRKKNDEVPLDDLPKWVQKNVTTVPLIPRIREALDLALEGLSNQEIAERMNIKKEVVADYVSMARKVIEKSLLKPNHIFPLATFSTYTNEYRSFSTFYVAAARKNMKAGKLINKWYTTQNDVADYAMNLTHIFPSLEETKKQKVVFEEVKKPKVHKGERDVAPIVTDNDLLTLQSLIPFMMNRAEEILTDQQLQAFRGYMSGKDIKTIAGSLGLSESYTAHVLVWTRQVLELGIIFPAKFRVINSYKSRAITQAAQNHKIDSLKIFNHRYVDSREVKKYAREHGISLE